MGIFSTPVSIRNMVYDFKRFVFDTSVVGKRGGLIAHFCL
jgi:hypothetical protein